MPRVSVYLPDELAATVREQLPGVNLSAALQGALSDLLGCRHDRAVCADCATPIDTRAATDAAMGRFYRDLLSALEDHMMRGGTGEGSARVAKAVAQRHQITAAERTPLPRPARARREAITNARERGEVTVFPDAFEQIDNHPDNPHRRTA